MATSNCNISDRTDSVRTRLPGRKESNTVRWYVLILPLSPQGEYRGNPSRRLQLELERRIRRGEPAFEYFAPSYVEVERRDGKLIRTNRPLLYNYVFIHASESEIYRMKRYLPQYNFLPRIREGLNGHYPYVTDETMKNLKWIAASYANVLPVYAAGTEGLMEGDRIRILEGEFKGMEASVMIRPGGGRKEVMVRIENCMYVPLFHVAPGQYEIIALGCDKRHIYARMDAQRLPAELHKALKNGYSSEGTTEEDRALARKVLRQYGNLQLASDVMRCKLYALLLPAYKILADNDHFDRLLATIRTSLPLIQAEQARALLLVTLYGCTNSCLYHDQAHALIDPWRKENPLKRSKQQLILRLDDYDLWLGHAPGTTTRETASAEGK